MRIVVKTEQLVSQKPRRLPPLEEKIVDAQVKEWLKEGIIEPCASEYASGVVSK